MIKQLIDTDTSISDLARKLSKVTHLQTSNSTTVYTIYRAVSRVVYESVYKAIATKKLAEYEFIKK